MRISDWSSDVCSSDLILSSARRATHVVTPSKAMLDSLLLWAPEIADKCSVNRYGTVPAFRGGRTRQWRADGTLRLLYVSVYYAHKNPAVVCAAADLLNAAGLPTAAKITMEPGELGIVGGAYDSMILRAARSE